MRNVLFIVIFMLNTLFALGAQKYDVSPNISVGPSEKRLYVLLTIQAPDDTITIDVPEFFQQAKCSQDNEYVAYSCGTDIVSGLIIYSLVSKKIVLTSSILEDFKGWTDNKLEYPKVLFFGDGYTICEKHVFSKGIDQVLGQYVGTYHFFGRPEPLSKAYKPTTDFENDIKHFHNYSDRDGFPNELFIKMMETELLSTKIVNRENIHEFNEITNDVFQELMDADKSYLVSDLFSDIYPIILYAYKQDVIFNREFNAITKSYLQYMNIDYRIVPWLFY
jgi:hypothetical protein